MTRPAIMLSSDQQLRREALQHATAIVIQRKLAMSKGEDGLADAQESVLKIARAFYDFMRAKGEEGQDD